MKPVYFLCFVLGFAMVFGSLTSEAYDLSPLTQAIAYLIEKEPGHPRKGDSEYAAEMALAVTKAGDKYEVDPWLLAAMAFRESRFRPDIISGKKKGKAGEVGLLQCGKDCARACPHFMDDVHGQALCGAHWFKISYDSCLEYKGRHSKEYQALVMYASGHHCEPPEDTPFGWKANKRVRLRDRLKNRFLPN